MKTVIYKRFGTYYTTTEENYYARIQNERKIHKMESFNSAQEIIDYYIRYDWAKSNEDFIIVEA